MIPRMYCLKAQRAEFKYANLLQSHQYFAEVQPNYYRTDYFESRRTVVADYYYNCRAGRTDSVVAVAVFEMAAVGGMVVVDSRYTFL